MKRYIHGNSIIETLPIEIFIEVPEAIYSAVDDEDDPAFFNEKNELIMSLYDRLIDDICTVCEMNGLELLYYEESESKTPTGEPSPSRYYDFCIKSQKQAGCIRLVFMLRLTDHHQTNKRRDGSNRRAAIDLKKAKRLADYQAKQAKAYPDSPESIYPFDREIKVGKTVCRTYGAAIRELEQYIRVYKQSVADIDSKK
jgi:hypothetical protein